MKFVSTAHGEKGWKKFSDLPEEERCQPGILRHRYEVEHDAPTGSSVQAANPQKSDALSAGHREQQAFRPRVKMAEEWTENQARLCASVFHDRHLSHSALPATINLLRDLGANRTILYGTAACPIVPLF